MEKFLNNKNLSAPDRTFKREPKIIGNAPEEAKKMVKEKYREYIYGGEDIIDMPREDLKKIKSIELEKRLQEIELIKAADEELSKIMEELGLEFFNVPAENVHIFDKKLYEDKKINIGGSAGFSISEEEFIGIPSDRRDDLFDFGAVVFHELNHLKGYRALKVDKFNKSEIEDDKYGNETEEDDGIIYAIKKYFGLIKKVPPESKKKGIGDFKKMFDDIGAESKEADTQGNKNEPEIKVNIYRSGLSVYVTEEKDARLTRSLEKQGKPITLSDLRSSYLSGLEEAVVAKMERRYCEKLLNNPIIKEAQQGKEIYNDMNRGYPRAQAVLNMMVSGIYEKNKDNFKSEDEVLNIFIKAHFTGQILAMSRLIKNTFGKEAFKKVAEMSGNSNISAASDALKIAKIREQIGNL